MAFDLEALLIGVFDPQAGERVVVACDQPTAASPDSPDWQERRQMAEEWRAAFTALGARRGFTVLPLLRFPATGASGAPLPPRGTLDDREAIIDEVLGGATLAAFLTEFSATAALDGYCRRNEDFRAASMPGLQKSMEQSALAADYREVARRCRILEEILLGAETLDVRFSTGDRCRFDLRMRKPEVDDGYLPRFKPGDRLINLPSGEAFIVPYEGEKPELPSRTEGVLPVAAHGGEVMLLEVKHNHIVSVVGGGNAAVVLREFFAVDAARTNIAEVAFGCNEWARVTGNVLEDEKAGFHWAYGRSDHLGGTVGVAAFARPENVVHHDIVYAAGNPIQIADATLVRPDGKRTVIRDGGYVVF